jgi:hypothetical protein
MRREGSQSLGSSSTVKLKRMFLDGRTPEQIRDAEARAQEQAKKKLRRQDAVLHHDFDKMRREVESLGELSILTWNAHFPSQIYMLDLFLCFAGPTPSVAACSWLIVNDTAHAAAGASMLGKKQKREFDRGVLHQVKAKPMKGPRIPANLGFSKPLLSARSRTEGVNAMVCQTVLANGQGCAFHARVALRRHCRVQD